MSYIGTNKVGKMYLGSTAIGKAYLGSDLVYDSAGGSVTPVLPYDAEIEYLQSTGSQYINTGIAPSTNFECEVKAEFTQNQAGFDTLLGSYTNDTAFGVALAISGNSSKLNGGYIQFGSASIVSSINTLGLHTYKSSLKNNTLKINVDGTEDSTSFGSGTPSANTMYLFARNKGGGTIGNYSKAKVYYCKIWNGGNLVFDAIPVRVGTTGYMYDRISGTLFGNSGSGSFVLGNDVGDTQPELPEGYIECEYISHSRSSYPPYINTGVKPTSEYRIVAKIENAIDNTENWPAIFGIRGANSTPRLECFAYKTYVQSFPFTGSSFETAYRTTSSSPHTIDLNKNRLIYDGVEYPSSSTGSWTSNMIFVIGTLNSNGTMAYGYSIPMKFYYFKIYDGSTLVRDFIPAYKESSQKYGFYDFVTGTFYSSARSGYEFSGLQKTT